MNKTVQMPSNRCSEFVIDNNTNRIRRCKLHCHFHGVCYIHARELYRDSATTIQKMWRGFKKRTKLQNLYYELPKELQTYVMRYVREDHYIEKKWIPSVRKVYKNRLCHYHSLCADLHLLIGNFEITENEYYEELFRVKKLQRLAEKKLDFLIY